MKILFLFIYIITASSIYSKEKHAIKIEVKEAGTMPIDDKSHDQIYFVKFKHEDGNGFLLWKAKPGMPISTGQDGLLKFINNKIVTGDKIGLINILEKDYSTREIQTKSKFNVENIKNLNNKTIVDKLVYFEIAK